MARPEVAIQKRQQIDKANKTMLIWVAGASAIVGICLVVSIFLMQKVIFKEKVLAESYKTQSVLVQNNKNAPALKDNLRALNTNEALASSMIDGQENAVEVVLDALPSTVNSSAFGASLEKKILENADLKIESLRVDPVFGQESEGLLDAAATDGTAPAVDNSIFFQFTILADPANPTALQAALQRIERSIRPISISKVVVERQPDRLALTASGVTYFEPAKNVSLKEKTIKP